MRALTFHGKHDIRAESVPDPSILANTDAIVRVRSCAICGSDLHVYHEHEKGLDAGTAVGHEFMGEVVEIGPEVRHLKKGTWSWLPSRPLAGSVFIAGSA
ncbi:MAG: alcohol dehydrogenase catalytic domain-containing protein [Haliscomenobacter sp.]|nr:alcohol dehydrogenase catalytic domain-containing protein [Haliscomenobacter sp.]